MPKCEDSKSICENENEIKDCKIQVMIRKEIIDHYHPRAYPIMNVVGNSATVSPSFPFVVGNNAFLISFLWFTTAKMVSCITNY